MGGAAFSSNKIFRQFKTVIVDICHGLWGEDGWGDVIFTGLIPPEWVCYQEGGGEGGICLRQEGEDVGGIRG